MKNNTEIRMPFGRWKGCLLSETNDDYIKWLEETPPFALRPWLQEAVAAEYERRLLGPAAANSRNVVELKIPAELRDLTEEAFEAGFRTLTKRYHPDVSRMDGSLMVALNQLREEIARQLRQTGGAA
jgi:hypothetical protein